MNFRKTVLPNGLRVITVPKQDSLAVTLLVLVEAGSKNETSENIGVSHFLEHMCFKGTSRRPNPMDISAELDGLGAQHNAFTSMEYTGYYAKCEASQFPKVLDVVSDLYLNPLFSHKEIDKERGVIIEEINMDEDDSMKKVGDVFMELLYGDQSAGRPIFGTKDSVARIKQEDIVNYRNENYLASSTVVVVAGRFNDEEVLGQIELAFGQVPMGNVRGKVRTVDAQSSPALSIKPKKLDQAHIVLGVRTYGIFDDRRYAIELISHILGGGMSSRLFGRLRNEMGAAYYVYADADFYTDHGYLAAASGVRKNSVEESVSAILGEFRRLKNELVPLHELDKVKKHISGSFILSLETSNQLASFYGAQEILEKNILTPEESIAKLNAVTSEEIMKVSKDIFVSDRLNLAVLGPADDSSKLQKLLTLD